MINYSIQSSNPVSRLVEIEIVVTEIKDPIVNLKLPAWRPGRYELQNYAKNILYFNPVDLGGNPLDWVKTNRNTWTINTKGKNSIRINYQYFCFQLDAGGSYIDDDVFYINPVNCILAMSQFSGKINFEVKLPISYVVSCGLQFDQVEKSDQKLFSTVVSNYYEIYDSPILASKNLISYTYEIERCQFKLWFYGISELPGYEELLQKFEKFTEYQKLMFGSFPFSEYNFQYLILPYKYYHGVEHRNSTVIVLGNQKDFLEGKLFDDFLGISSHELLHAWNICKIRPSELLPYNYDEEQYFQTGFVAEGFTTYLGDYILFDSGVIDKQQYKNELENVLTRYLNNPGNFQYSLAESSIDLWVDGYQQSHPERKVSIYDKGAAVSLIFDAQIRKLSNGRHRLEDVLKILWVEFAQVEMGYKEKDIKSILVRLAGEEVIPIFEECIFGKGSLVELLQESLQILDIELNVESLYGDSLLKMGYTTKTIDGRVFVDKVNPEHKSYFQLSINDEIICTNPLRVIRNGRIILIDG